MQAAICLHYGTLFASLCDMKLLLTRVRQLLLYWLLLSLIALYVTDISAAQMQSHESIREVAKQHILNLADTYPAPPVVTAGHLDSRLRLAACEQPLETFAPKNRRNTGKITVGVRCNGEKPWTLYVPVTVSIMLPVVVTTTDIHRGTLIRKEDLQLEMRDISSLHRGYLESLDQAVGKSVKQSIRSNQVVTPSKIVSPRAIKRNSRVTILASSNSIQVRMAGIALENGSIGERIRIRNQSSNLEIDAKVVAPGVVQVAM
jgi:flagella basal body P-ring formation protein FlgA